MSLEQTMEPVSLCQCEHDILEIRKEAIQTKRVNIFSYLQELLSSGMAEVLMTMGQHLNITTLSLGVISVCGTNRWLHSVAHS